MAPDTGATRPLSISEQELPLGTKLNDGYLIVSGEVAHKVALGEKELKRRRQRKQRAARATRRHQRR